MSRRFLLPASLLVLLTLAGVQHLAQMPVALPPVASAYSARVTDAECTDAIDDLAVAATASGRERRGVSVETGVIVQRPQESRAPPAEPIPLGAPALQRDCGQGSPMRTLSPSSCAPRPAVIIARC